MRGQKFLDQLSCKISEIMRKKFEMADWRPFWILLVRNLSWVIFCVRPSILFYIHGPANLHFFESPKYHKLLKCKMAAKRPFLNFCSQKGIR